MATESGPAARIVRAIDERSWLVPLLLFAGGCVAYVLIGAGRIGPTVANDEYLYGNLAQSLAAGDGFTWRGGGVGLRTIYPYLIAPAWVVSDGDAAYRLAKAINVALLCATVVPVWLVARELVGPRLAALPPALVLTGMWMESGARLMTEALALPAATLALCAAYLYLRHRTPRWFLIALLGAALATLARSQLVLLVAVIGLALVAELLRTPRSRRREVAGELRFGLLATAGAAVVAAVALIAARTDAVGDYAGFADARPNLGQVAAWSVDYASGLTFMVGVVPWVVALALLSRRAAWRDERIGPFLAILAPALVVLILLAGWFSAGISLRPVERYVFYLAPLLVVALVAGLPWIRWPGVVGAGLLSALIAVLAHDPTRFGGESQALFGAAHKLGFLDGSGRDFMGRMAVVVLVIALLLAAAVWLRQRSERLDLRGLIVRTTPTTLVICVVVSGAGMALVSQDLWKTTNEKARTLASAFGGEPLDGLDEGNRSPHTLVASEVPPFYVMWVEFFNKRINRVIVQPAKGSEATAGYGTTCPLRIDEQGRFANGRCADGNRSFVFASNPASAPTLVGGSRFKGGDLDPFGLLFASAGEPQLVAQRPQLCPKPALACQPATIRTWSARRARLVLEFAGGVQAFQVEVAGRLRTLEAGAATTVQTAIGPGARETLVRPGWPDARPGTPVLQSVRLIPVGGSPVALN